MNWGGKWRKVYKDYPETWESGNKLIARDMVKNIRVDELVTMIREGIRLAYKKGYEDGSNDKGWK